MLELARLSAELKIKDGAECGNKHFKKKLINLKFAKLFCVLIIPEVKKNDSSNTHDDEVKKLFFILSSTFSEGDGCY